MGTNDAEVENQKNSQTNTFTSHLPLSEVENQKNLQAKPFNSNPTLSLPNPEFDEEPERDSSNSNTETRSLSQRKRWIPNVSLQAVEEENHRDLEEAIEVIPQVSQLAMDHSEEVRKFKVKEKIYADKAFNDNGLLNVKVVTALENGWLTEVSPVFSRVVLNLEQELWPGLFVKDVLEGAAGCSLNSVPGNSNFVINPVQGGQDDSVVGIPLPDEDAIKHMEDMESMEVEQILTEWAIYEELNNAK
ncbi:hypothetical protein ACET3Z_013799 [Daucus carota]